jgi:predicted DNA repair protein MutK
MKELTIVGTPAMFLVGGSIFAHGITVVHELFELVLHLINKPTFIGSVLTILVSMLLNDLGNYRWWITGTYSKRVFVVSVGIKNFEKVENHKKTFKKVFL